MKKIIRWALVVLVLAAVGVGGYWYYQSHVVSAATTTSGQTYAQIVEVTQGNMAATASVVGQLEAEQSASLAFEKMSDTANLLTLAVQAGNVVTKGQVLATIDSLSYQQSLDQANSDLQAAEETLADIKTPATALKVAQADVAVSKAKVALQKAQDALDDLLNPDIPSLESTVASAKSALAKAQANVLAQQQDTAAKTQLDKLIYAETTPTAEYNRLAERDLLGRPVSGSTESGVQQDDGHPGCACHESVEQPVRRPPGPDDPPHRPGNPGGCAGSIGRSESRRRCFDELSTRAGHGQGRGKPGQS